MAWRLWVSRIFARATRLVVGSSFCRSHVIRAFFSLVNAKSCTFHGLNVHHDLKLDFKKRCSSQLGFLHKYVVIGSCGGEGGGCDVLSSVWHLSYHSRLHNLHHWIGTTGPRGGKSSPKTKSAKVRTHAGRMWSLNTSSRSFNEQIHHGAYFFVPSRILTTLLITRRYLCYACLF